MARRRDSSETEVYLFDPNTQKWVSRDEDDEPQEGTLRLRERKIYSFRDYNVAEFSIFEGGEWKDLTRQEVLGRFGPHAAGLVFNVRPAFMAPDSFSDKAPFWRASTQVIISEDLEPLFDGLGAFTVIRGYGKRTKLTAFDWTFYLPPDRLDEFVRRVEEMGGVVRVYRPWEGAEEKMATATALAEEIEALAEQARAAAERGDVGAMEVALTEIARKVPTLRDLRGELERIVQVLTGWPEHTALLTRIQVALQRVKRVEEDFSAGSLATFQERLARKAAAAIEAAGPTASTPVLTGLAAALGRHPEARQVGPWTIVPLFHGLVIAVKGDEVKPLDAILSDLDEEGIEVVTPMLAQQAKEHEELAARYKDLVVMLLKGGYHG